MVRESDAVTLPIRDNQDMGGDREGAEREAISLGILVTGCTYQPGLSVSVQTYVSMFTGRC